MNILLGVTGSVAATLTDKLRTALKQLGDVKVIVTDSAVDFLPVQETLDASYLCDDDEWGTWRDGDVLHIVLRKWADVFVIAPMSANTLGKIANGICDNLVTSVAAAWDYSRRLQLVNHLLILTMNRVLSVVQLP